MTSIHEFFDDLERRGHDPLLERVTATVRFDLHRGGGGGERGGGGEGGGGGAGDETERILVHIDRGDITVSADEAPADCVVSGEAALLDAIADGQTSVMTALLRGQLTVDGDPELLVLTQRLFPGGAAKPRTDQPASGGRST